MKLIIRLLLLSALFTIYSHRGYSADIPYFTAKNKINAVTFDFSYAGSDASGHYILVKPHIPLETKTYWKIAGFGGIDPVFDFSNSTNMKSYSALWGVPEKHTTSGILNYILPQNKNILIRFVPENAGFPMNIKGIFDYGYCDTQCKAGQKNIDMTLSASDIPAITPAELKKIIDNEPSETAFKEQNIKIFEFKSQKSDNNYVISFYIEGLEHLKTDDLFYVLDTPHELIEPTVQKIRHNIYSVVLDFGALKTIPKKYQMIIASDSLNKPVLINYDISFKDNNSPYQGNE
jgi:hypothetical protein